MLSMKHGFMPLLVAALALAALATFGIRQYGWNPSALLHVDHTFGKSHDVPPRVVLYQDGGYDGMLYYQVARDLPALLSDVPLSDDSAYRFQRILLPLFVFAVTLGHDAWFPLATLVLNIAAAIGCLWLGLRLVGHRSIHGWVLVFNPAILIGILYSLTEPLSIFFLLAFLLHWEAQARRMDWFGVAALVLSLLARETTVFLIAFLGLWYVWKREWKPLTWLALTLALFAAWQIALTLRFGVLPFGTGGHMIGWPLEGPASLARWIFFETGMALVYRWSSIPFLAFVIGTSAFVAWDWKQKNANQDALGFVLSGLCAVMLTMDSHIWGVITSIGRVIAPFYPVYALFAASRDGRFVRFLSWFLIAFSIVVAIGVAAVRHPYVVS